MQGRLDPDLDALTRLPDYVSKYEPTRIYTLHYRVADAEGMRACLREAAARGVGWTYVTDDDLPNPWDTLPPYWDEQAGAARPKSDP